MKKLLFLFFSLLSLINNSKAQQSPYFSTYFFNPTLINPSLSPLYENNNVILVYRNQWTNYKPNNYSASNDSPNTGIFSLNLQSRDKILGFGINLISDNLGPKEVFDLSPYFSINKKINNSVISFSLSPTIKTTTLNFSSLIFVDPNDPFNIGGKESQSKPDLDFGLSFISDKVVLSGSINNVTQSSFNFGLNDLDNINKMSFSFLGKYIIEIDRDLNIEPLILFRSDLTSYTFDISSIATYKNNLKLGASYRYDEAIVAFIGSNFLKNNKLFVGYSFDYVVHNVSVKAPMSHELILRYDLPTPQLKKPIRTPRFFF